MPAILAAKWGPCVVLVVSDGEHRVMVVVAGRDADEVIAEYRKAYGSKVRVVTADASSGVTPRRHLS